MAIGFSFKTRHDEIPLPEKLIRMNWGLLLLLTAIALIGVLALYSAGGGTMEPWAGKHLTRYVVAVILCLIVALIDIRFWMRMAYLAYAGSFVLLLAVELMGFIGMGAQRWINLGFIQLQPSELMKITLVMALARYFHGATYEETGQFRFLLIPAALIAAPALLVLKQPDLGTAGMLGMAGLALFLLAGVRWWKFLILGIAGAVTVPLAWMFVLHDYQKSRVMTFLDPESDPLGAGYHIMQSKIALGSGGLKGKGFLEGTQSHLNFLPEKQTDFIFTLLAEEWGFVGGVFIMALFACVFVYGYIIAHSSHHHFGRLLAMGLTINFALYVFINIAMVMSLFPVVGVPLPLVSYGGTVMLTTMIGFGLILSVSIHKSIKIPRYL